MTCADEIDRTREHIQYKVYDGDKNTEQVGT